MGLFKFILGVLGILLIVGTFGSFLPLVFLGGLSSGSVGFALSFPIALFVIGAALVYYGFYYHGSSYSGNNEMKHFLKWGFIHAFSIWLALFLADKLGLSHTALQVLLMGVVVSAIAQIVRSSYSHFNFRWATFYFAVHAVVSWLAVFVLLPVIGVRHPIAVAVLTGFAIVAATTVINKVRINYAAAPWAAAIMLLLVGIFTVSAPSELLTDFKSISPSAADGAPQVDPMCEQRVRDMIGDSFVMKYTIDTTTNNQKLDALNSRFTNRNNDFDSNTERFSGNSLTDSETTTRKVIKSDLRPGMNVGERADWLYGSFIYEYKYHREKVTNANGVIQGDNEFAIRVTVDRVEKYAPTAQIVDNQWMQDKYGAITIPSREIVTVTSCEFSDMNAYVEDNFLMLG